MRVYAPGCPVKCFNPLAPFIEARTSGEIGSKSFSGFQSTSPVYRG